MLEAGFAGREITPPVGLDIPGGFGARVSTGVLDPLMVTAGAVRQDATTVCIIGVDAVSLTAATTDAVRTRIAAAMGMRFGDVIVAASHAHCAGPTNWVLGTDADPTYLATLSDHIFAAATAACAALQPVRCVAGQGSCAGWVFNRRFKMRDGSEASMPAYDNPDIVGPAGPVDPGLGMIGFVDMAGTPIGAIASIACHPTMIWGDQYSADYPGAWRTALRTKLHADFTLVFINGACGNIAGRNNAAPPPTGTALERTAAMGAALADETARLFATCPVEPAAKLATAAGSAVVRFRRPTAAALAAARELLARQDPDTTTWKSTAWQARDLILLAEELGDAEQTICPVNAVRIGAAVIAASPWQPFSEFGLQIKQHSPWFPTLLATFANGSLGYVPTPEGFAGGGYEPTLCRGSKLATDAGQAIVTETLRVLTSELN